MTDSQGVDETRVFREGHDACPGDLKVVKQLNSFMKTL